MFPGGEGSNPVNKWVKRLSKFYKKHGIKVQSHDFRVTTATEFYEEGKDLVKLQKFLAHSSIKVTALYVKKDEKEITTAVSSMLKKRARNPN